MVLLIILILLAIAPIILDVLDSEELPALFKEITNVFHKYDIQDQMSFFQEATWVIKVIKSCETWKQFYNSKKLIAFLNNKYENKVKPEVIEEIMNKLRSVSNVKRYEVD